MEPHRVIAKMASSLVHDEIYRLQRLKALAILDTPVEIAFDAITKAAAHVVRVPIALLNFIDESREWCKSAWGMGRQTARRDESICAQAMHAGSELVIPDALVHPGFFDHPQVVGARKVVAYVGIVIKTRDGVALGTLCAIDHQERVINEEELHALRTLANSVSDLLETRRLEAELADATFRLESVAKSRDEFLAMLAHELRAPLAPIHTAVEVLDRPGASKAQRKWSREILKRHTRYMSRIVDDLLSASLVSIGAIDLKLKSIDVASMVEQAMETCDEVVRQAKHKVTVTVDHDLSARADATQCPLILSNLLRNAAVYTAAGGIIDIVATGIEDRVLITVRDNGAGIAPCDIERIFQLFAQTGRSLARTKGGMGLGLTLARRLAELHGGTLAARSEGLGFGSEFILTLERATGDASVAPPRINEIGDPDMRLSLLVVDDNQDAADAMGMYFDVSGYDVRVVYTAADAIEAARIRAPDVLLSDIGLPDMTGYALVREIKRLDACNAPLCIAISGYATVADKDSAVEAGFDAHVAKPADVRSLEALVHRLFDANAKKNKS
jgi:signal transduction histidine kinase/ActR/RegA family two-component response regulator